MNLTYNITTVLANFDALDPVLLVSYGLTLACFVVYYIAAIVKGFKDKHCGMPWQTNAPASSEGGSGLVRAVAEARLCG